MSSLNGNSSIFSQNNNNNATTTTNITITNNYGSGDEFISNPGGDSTCGGFGPKIDLNQNCNNGNTPYSQPADGCQAEEAGSSSLSQNTSETLSFPQTVQPQENCNGFNAATATAAATTTTISTAPESSPDSPSVQPESNLMSPEERLRPNGIDEQVNNAIQLVNSVIEFIIYFIKTDGSLTFIDPSNPISSDMVSFVNTIKETINRVSWIIKDTNNVTQSANNSINIANDAINSIFGVLPLDNVTFSGYLQRHDIVMINWAISTINSAVILINDYFRTDGSLGPIGFIGTGNVTPGDIVSIVGLIRRTSTDAFNKIIEFINGSISVASNYIDSAISIINNIHVIPPQSNPMSSDEHSQPIVTEAFSPSSNSTDNSNSTAIPNTSSGWIGDGGDVEMGSLSSQGSNNLSAAGSGIAGNNLSGVMTQLSDPDKKPKPLFSDEDNRVTNTNKNTVVDNDGKVMFKSISHIKVNRGSIHIYVAILYVKILIPKNTGKDWKNYANNEKIADVGDEIYVIHCDCDDYCLFKVISGPNSRNEVLWKRKFSDIKKCTILLQEDFMEFVVEKLGMFGPQNSLSSCFFVPFGVKKGGKIQTGVWFSEEYYKKIEGSRMFGNPTGAKPPGETASLELQPREQPVDKTVSLNEVSDDQDSYSRGNDDDNDKDEEEDISTGNDYNY